MKLTAKFTWHPFCCFFFKYLIAWGVNEQLMDPMASLNSVFIIAVDSYDTHLILEAYGIAVCVLLN